MAALSIMYEYTYEEYLRYEENSEEKHEFADGQILAMTGGSVRHAALTVAVSFQFGRQLENGKPCRVYSSDLRVVRQNVATYADVTVVCGPIEVDEKDKNGVTNPFVLVEVTSPSTEARDRGGKLAHYKTIPSLWAVVVVSQRERLVEMHWIASDGHWDTQTATTGKVAVPGIDCVLDVDELYAAVESV
jgi:Uma2 family endonuclease